MSRLIVGVIVAFFCSPAFAIDSVAVFSARTLVVGIEVDRDQAEIVGYTLKDRPYRRAVRPVPERPYRNGQRVQIEVVLVGPGKERHVRRVETGPLCFEHGVDAEPHVAGDTIRSHRDSFVVELPELTGHDRIRVAYYETGASGISRRLVGRLDLTPDRFRAAAGPFEYADLRFAGPIDDDSPVSPQGATQLWPENFDDTDIYRVEGDEAEVDKRINVVIVPDGYTYADKALMDSHANSMIAYFRNKSPYSDHDNFLNYTLVYAYSQQGGTDQCDCDIVTNTHFGTRFPQGNDICGHTDNRCLYYGGGCDTDGTNNIVDAELRAPAVDATIVMVNTDRYGGCGGARAVYSAGVSSATEVAVHELGHSLGGLADEYESNSSCGFSAGEINTSTDSLNGGWPEWIGDLGPPVEGGQYYSQCIYRPEPDCEMRSLGPAFCPVCKQRWALVYFTHSRIGPTAPVSSFTPGTFLSLEPGESEDFSVTTRFAVGASVTNDIVWEVSGPGGTSVVATGTESYNHVFNDPGFYSVTCTVTADTNFIKPTKYGPNRDQIGWSVSVASALLPPEISGAGAFTPLQFFDADTLLWENAGGLGVTSYNLYRGDVSGLAGGDYGDCDQGGLDDNHTPVLPDPPDGVGWFYLVTGKNSAGEGPAGTASSGALRVPTTPCP